LPEIQEHFESLVHSVAQKIEDLSIQENKLESKKRDVHEQNQELKHQISSHFEDLRQKLDAKEREFINQLDL
jgi:chaperonin cofactor prefoldin